MSTVMSKTFFAAMLAMASTASAHMVMTSPVPFGQPQRDPLDISGSNFPCQGGAYTVKSMNEWTVGSEVTLKIEQNTATHGGGSCQVSVTKDKTPTASSVWKVVHSIEGGCVTTGPGNDGPVGSYPFTVPAELPDGELTMAWTWFNKVGNREMYMNCAPITVSGGSGDGFDDLPDMMTANIGQGSCTTSEGFDYTFANPGKSVTKLGTGPYKELCGGAPSTGGSSGGSGSGTPAAPVAPVATPIAAPVTPPKDAAAPVPAAPSTGGGSSGGGACTTDGAIVCNGESQFGICNHGSAVYQAVAAGTRCSNGAIMRRDFMHRHQRRSI